MTSHTLAINIIPRYLPSPSPSPTPTPQYNQSSPPSAPSLNPKNPYMKKRENLAILAKSAQKYTPHLSLQPIHPSISNETKPPIYGK